MMKVESRSRELAVGAGWHPDPHGQHHLRYFDGRAWTSHVTHYGPVPCQRCAGSN